MKPELLNALLLAIRALNAMPDFNTGIPCPDDREGTLRSYRLIPQLETVARKAKASPINCCTKKGSRSLRLNPAKSRIFIMMRFPNSRRSKRSFAKHEASHDPIGLVADHWPL
jgi:hypothetical protein